ncbi:hypothetical protein VTK56DRAFT_1942 [Thermocarpiscus australiensis]
MCQKPLPTRRPEIYRSKESKGQHVPNTDTTQWRTGRIPSQTPPTLSPANHMIRLHRDQTDTTKYRYQTATPHPSLQYHNGKADQTSNKASGKPSTPHTPDRTEPTHRENKNTGGSESPPEKRMNPADCHQSKLNHKWKEMLVKPGKPPAEIMLGSPHRPDNAIRCVQCQCTSTHNPSLPFFPCPEPWCCAVLCCGCECGWS